jgi:hypothetical protein
MKPVIPLAVGTLCLGLITTLPAQSLLPGQVDFGNFTPSGGADFVEVNVPSSLITFAVKLVEKDEPDVAHLLAGLKLVHVNVIGLTDDNRAEIQKRAQKLRKELSGKGWERIVAAQQKDQDVGIYLKMGEKSEVQGLAAVVSDGNEHAVFVNVVGDIKPEQLSMLGEKLHISALKKIQPLEKSEDDSKEKLPDKSEK